MASTSMKPAVLSYADRAKRAGGSTGSASVRSRSTASTGNPLADSDAQSPTSSQNVTPSSSVVLTRPGTPPPPQDEDEASHPSDSTMRSPKATPSPNIWAARKEQMAQRAAVVTSQPSLAFQSQPVPQTPAASVPSNTNQPSFQSNNGKYTSTPEPTLNGINKSASHGNTHSAPSKKDRGDLVIVHMPASTPRTTSSAPTPPSLDDEQSWPEMGKPLPSSSVVSPNTQEVDKKEPAISATPKKSEKTKWVPIPAAELQAAADSQTQSHHRTQSQHGQRKQSTSRRQSHSRNTSRHNNREGRVAEARGPSDEGSVNQSRTGSVVHSRVGSVHSSPRYLQRGRRLPEDGPITGISGYAYQSSLTQTLSIRRVHGDIAEKVNEGSSIASQPPEDVPITPTVSSAPPYIDPSFVQSTSSSSYSSQSHIYYPPPVTSPYDASAMRNMYGQMQPNGFPPQMMPQSAPPHIPYPIYPPFPPATTQHPPYASYMYMPYAYYPPPPGPQTQGQGHERLQQPMLYEHGGQPTLDQGAISPQMTVLSHTVVSQQMMSPILPPTTQRTRPPPPGESTALAGYRDITAVPVSPLINAGTTPMPSFALAGGQAQQTGKDSLKVPAPTTSMSKQQGWEKEREMLFGSVGRPGGLKSPSPMSSPIMRPEQGSSLGLDIGQEIRPSNGKATFTTFSIGVNPDEAGPSTLRLRGRNKIKHISERKGSIYGNPDDGSSTNEKSVFVDNEEAVSGEDEEVVIKIIDLTDPQTTLEFGTSKRPEIDGLSSVDDDALSGEANPVVPAVGPDQHVVRDVQPELQYQPVFPYPLQPMPHQHQMGYPPFMPMHIAPVPMQSSSPQPPQISQHASVTAAHMLPNMLPQLSMPRAGFGGSEPASAGDEFEVKDFGYGFGPLSGSGYMPERLREERVEREFRDRDRDRDREFVGYGRNRRGSTSGYSGYGGGYESRGYERGGFRGRRGRVGPPYGRGLYGSRGGFAGRAENGQRYQQQLPFVGQPQYQYQPHSAPPSHQSQPSDASVGYYSSPPSSSYMQSPYTPYAPPLPPARSHSQSPQTAAATPPTVAQMPMTALSFPVDDTRFYLLGQIEYYFSLQNLATDFWLRQQIDSQGWVPIPLIASFNRVKRLTQDVDLVRDALTLSSLVEVRGDHVRLRNDHWRQWVLPQAAQSLVKGSDTNQDILHLQSQERNEEIQTADEGEVEDEEDDDVVFVLERNAITVE